MVISFCSQIYSSYLESPWAICCLCNYSPPQQPAATLRFSNKASGIVCKVKQEKGRILRPFQRSGWQRNLFQINSRLTRDCGCLLVQRFGWELKLPHGDGVHSTEGNPGDMLALQADEVVLADQEGPVRDEDKALLLVVPVVDSGQRTPLSFKWFWLPARNTQELGSQESCWGEQIWSLGGAAFCVTAFALHQQGQCRAGGLYPAAHTGLWIFVKGLPACNCRRGFSVGLDFLRG